MPDGQIIILNGAPRSGKSSIVAEIQRSFDGIWMNLGVDRFMQMTPERYLPGIGLRPGGGRPDLEPVVVQLYGALYDSIAAHSRLGLNVVVDVGHHDAYSRPLGILPDSARRLEGLPALLVGVRCPIEVVLERRRATGWTRDDEVERASQWDEEVHRQGIYDLEVDTAVLSPVDCADAVRRRLLDGRASTALQLLAHIAKN